MLSVLPKETRCSYKNKPQFLRRSYSVLDYDGVLECEYYLPRTDQWIKVAPMLTGQSDVGIAVYNDRIYVTGGYR